MINDRWLMSVAVLIVNFRAYAALERCLRSLAPVLSPADEVIVVDHESDEGALARAAACHGVVTIARPDNPGFAAGVNRAVARSRASHLLLLNPDTEMTAGLVPALAAWLDAHPDTGVAGPRVLNTDGTVQPTARRYPGFTTVLGGRSTWLTERYPDHWLARWNLVGQRATGPLAVDWISGACMMTRRDLFDRLGGFDESFFLYHEDIDYCRRAAALGFRSVYLPSVSVTHAVGACAAFAPVASIRAFHDSAYRYYCKHTGPIGLLMAPLVRAGLLVRARVRVNAARRREAAPTT